MELCNITGLKGKVTIPGDKSISHRCIMFGSIANGTTQIHNFLSGADCLATIRCFRELGIEIEVESDYSSVIVHGKGLHGLSAPEKILDVGNSGTTTRLISGILAGQPFDSKFLQVITSVSRTSESSTTVNSRKEFFVLNFMMKILQTELLYFCRNTAMSSMKSDSRNEE